MKKLLASATIVVSSLCGAGSAKATLSNCSIGTYWGSGVAKGAYSVCYGPSGGQRIVVNCSDGSQKVGAWVGSGMVSKSTSSGLCSGIMLNRHVQFRI